MENELVTLMVKPETLEAKETEFYSRKVMKLQIYHFIKWIRTVNGFVPLASLLYFLSP